MKRSCGWHKAKRSGIHDQMSFISFALTISEEKVSGLRASWTFRLWTEHTKRGRNKNKLTTVSDMNDEGNYTVNQNVRMRMEKREEMNPPRSTK